MARKASRTTFLTTNDSLDEPMLKYRRTRGFTIVELLIVIVVIAILAAITVVAYTGIRDRANLSALQSELSGQARQLAAWRAQNNDQYPATLAGARTAGMLNNTKCTEYTKYIVTNTTNPANYCATGLRGGVSFSVSSTGSAPTAGECVTNLIVNPSFEIDTTGWVTANGASLNRTSSTALVGSSFGAQVSTSSTSDSGIGAQVAFTSGRTYSTSCWLRTPQAGTYAVSAQHAAIDSVAARASAPFGASEIKRLASTWTTTGAGSAMVCMRTGGQSGTATFAVDGVMMTDGNQPYTYGDGESPGWFWNGTPHNSTSTGPAVAQ